MCSLPVLCPLCAQTSFSSIDALRCSLIKAANGPLACPICHELFLGLDKLTIHLFSHTNIMNSANSANATIAPATDAQNLKNIEKLKAHQQIVDHNNTNNNTSNCNDSEIQQTQFICEVNLNSTHHTWEKSKIQEPEETAKADKNIINKTNSTQQEQQQIGTMLQSDRETMSKNEKLAQCEICEFTFRNEELRNMHVRLVHENFEYHRNGNGICKKKALSPANGCCQDSTLGHDFKCHLCSKTFKTKGSLRVHLKVVHLMGMPYMNNNTPKLTICDRIRHKENKSSKSSLTNNSKHQQIQNDHININSSKADHKNSNHNNNNPFDVSPNNFISNLNAIPATPNISMMNLNQTDEFQQNDLPNSIVPTSNILVVFNSSEPSELEPSLNAISNHVNSNTTIGIVTIPPNNNVIENPKIWECDVCSKAFTTKYFLKKHKRLHTGEMPYTCELCARTFTFQQSYHKHLLYHSDEKPHVCSTCGRAFKELSTLHNHERIHSGEKPFKCEVCDKSFRQRVSFLVHSRIHTGVMPYKCEICQKSFRYKVSQRTHKCLLNLIEETTPPPEENTIDKMSENFIKAFLENTALNQADNHLYQSDNTVTSEKSSSLNEQQAMLTKTIDDIVVESCNQMGIGSSGFTLEQIINEGSMSPSQKLQNMHLYSPQLVTPDLNGMDGDLTRFFLETSQSGNNLL